MKNTFSLLLLLIVAFVTMACYSYFKEPSKFHDSDMVVAEDIDSTATIDTTPQVDSLPQTILLFGDSMATPFSYRLRDYATANGHTLTTISWCSATTNTWAVTDTLENFLNRLKPTQVFICLGANQLFVKDLETVDNDIKIIKNKLGNIPAVWIGPPNWKPDTGINDLLLKNMGENAYYPSYKLTFDRLCDGRHPTDPAAAAWCDSVVVWIKEGHTKHNFLLEEPHAKGKQTMYYWKLTN